MSTLIKRPLHKEKDVEEYRKLFDRFPLNPAYLMGDNEEELGFEIDPHKLIAQAGFRIMPA